MLCLHEMGGSDWSVGLYVGGYLMASCELLSARVLASTAVIFSLASGFSQVCNSSL